VTFTTVLPENELWTGEMRGLVVNGRRLLLVRTEDAICAYEDRCAHLGVPLSTGKLKNGVITCSAHHYAYDARTGRGINPENVALKPLPVCVRGRDIQVDVGERR
jgi:toluene monooxygenase system ferredoxin subunit